MTAVGEPSAIEILAIIKRIKPRKPNQHESLFVGGARQSFTQKVHGNAKKLAFSWTFRAE